MDLYDPVNHEYYEVTTQKQAGSDNKNKQMEKYDESIIYDWRFPEVEDMSSPTRGTNNSIYSEFEYKNWDVEYESKGDGYITYEVENNKERYEAAVAATIAAVSVAGMGYAMSGGKTMVDVMCYQLM